jgi:hypothetical protein
MDPFTTGGKFAAANFKKSSEAPVEPVFQVLRAFFLMGYSKKWSVGRCFLMVNSW